jgi:hypothetical protein
MAKHKRRIVVMKKQMRLVRLLLVPIMLAFASTSWAAVTGPVVGQAVKPQLSPRVLDLPVQYPAGSPAGEVANRRNPDPAREGAKTSGPADPLVSARAISVNTPAPLLSFDGIDNISNVTPPDPIGAVGVSEYVQVVNATYMAVYSKSGQLLHGPVQLNDLWTSGGCANSNSGDPVVLFDSLASRWVVAQFRANFANGICMAVSQTASALGAFFGYEFVFPDFPDYLKIGAWSDAYYLGSNENSGYSAYAIDRASMLNGQPASFIRFTGETNFLMPATVNGATPPPAGSPGVFYTFKDDSFHGGADRLEVFGFHADFAVPANSTFTLTDTLPVTPYTYTVCGFFRLNCIPQPASLQRVDAVSEWPMWPLAYRNFGPYEALVANFTIDVGNDRAGIRWYELRRSGSAWSVFQEGTHAPGSEYRWMGSINMDGLGNIALGYSIDLPRSPGNTIFPSLRYATRSGTDPLNTLQTETTLVSGTASQSGSNRWGDYSAMSVDPVDNCTFW